MPRNKKSFIDKKKALSFHLVHGSQRDPLAKDETAPQHVLLQPSNRVEMEKRREEQRRLGVFFNDNYDYLQHLRELEKAYPSDLLDRDNFDLRDEGGEEEEEWDMDQAMPVATISLPSSVFASKFEEGYVGLLNKAAPISGPGLDMDPDLVAGIDDDFDFDDPDNVLDDDFITMASDVM